ncbi:MAG: Ig-like domain-containing protein [Bacilli bacterium]
MKKIISYLLLGVLALLLVGCKKDDPVYTLSLTGADTVKVGEAINLTASSTKPSAIFVWSSSNEAIATVESGLVMGVAKGTAIIKVTVEGVGEKTLTITVTEEVIIIPPKEYTPTELKVLLEDTLVDYSESLSGYAKIEAVNGPDVLTSELMFNFNNEPGIDSMMYTLNGSEVAHVYVKEGVAYMLRNELKTKAEMTATEEATIINNYGFDKFVESIAAFYSEVEFYDALTFVSRVENVLTYTLGLSEYLGDVFVTEGKDSITLKVYLGADDVVLKVETLIVEGANNNYTLLEFKGLGVQTITYPIDLDIYE